MQFARWGRAAILLLGAEGCGAGEVQLTTTISSIEVSPREVEFDAVGAYEKVVATVLDSRGRAVRGVDLWWEVEDNEIASIRDGGVLQARRDGTTRLRVRVKGRPVEQFVSVTVKQVPTKVIFLEQPSNIVAGEPFAPSIRVGVVDRLGSAAQAADGDVQLRLIGHMEGAELIGHSGVRLVDGSAVFRKLTIHKRGSGIRLGAWFDGLPMAMSDPFEVTSEPEGWLQFRGDLAARWGEPFDVVAEIVDRFGNPVDLRGAFDLRMVEAKAGAFIQGKTLVWSEDGVITWRDLMVKTQVVDPPTDECFEGLAISLVAEGEGLKGVGHLDLEIPFVSLSPPFCGLKAAGWVYCWGSEVGISVLEDTWFRSPRPIRWGGRVVEVGGRFNSMTPSLGVKLDDGRVLSSEPFLEHGEPNIVMPTFLPGDGEQVLLFDGRYIYGSGEENELFFLSMDFAFPGEWRTERWVLPAGEVLSHLTYRWALTERGAKYWVGGIRRGDPPHLEADKGVVGASDECQLRMIENDEVVFECSRFSGSRDMEEMTLPIPADEVEKFDDLCVISRAGRLFCRSRDYDRDYKEVPHPQGKKFIESAVRSSHNGDFCALDEGGEIFCWEGRYIGHGPDVRSVLHPHPIDCKGYH